MTGGGRGIGKAIALALALAEAGCDVAVNYVSREAAIAPPETQRSSICIVDVCSPEYNPIDFN